MKYLLQRIPRAVAGILLVGLAGTFAGCGSDLLGTEDDDKPVVLSIDGARQVSAFYGEQKTTAFTLSLKGDDWSDALTSATADASAEQPADISDYFDVFLYDANDTNITARTLSNWQVCATGAVERTDFSGQTSYSEGIVARLSITLQLTFNNVSADDVTGTIKLYAKPATTRGGSYQMTTNQFPCIVEGKSYGIKKPTYDVMAAAGANKNVTLLTFADPLLKDVAKDDTIATISIDGSDYEAKAVQTSTNGGMSVSVYLNNCSQNLVGQNKSVKITYRDQYVIRTEALETTLDDKVCYVKYGQAFEDVTDIRTVVTANASTYNPTITLGEDDTKYAKIDFNVDNMRGQTATIKTDLESLDADYKVEFDLKLAGPNAASASRRQDSQFVLGASAIGTSGNNAYSGGYLFALSNYAMGNDSTKYGDGTGDTDSGNTVTHQNGQQSVLWTLGLTGGIDSKEITLDRTKKYHFVITVDASKKVTAVAYSDDEYALGSATEGETIEATSTVFSNINMLVGRSNTYYYIDNIVVYQSR